MFFPNEGAVDARLLTRATWLSAERRGVRFVRASPSPVFASRAVCAGAWRRRRAAFEAPVVVDAAGAWAAFDPGVSVPVQPVRGQIVQVRASGEPLSTLVCSDEVYLVPRADGTVLLGSTVEFVGFRKEVTAGAVRMLLASAARLVPSIAAARFVTAWAGLRPGTPDGLPVPGPIAGSRAFSSRRVTSATGSCSRR